MTLEKDNYTKQEVEELIKNLNKQIADATATIAEQKKQLEKLPELTKASMENAIKVEMLKAGLSENLFDLVIADDVEVAKVKISKLQQLQKKQDIDNSYKPQNRKSNDEYAEAEKKGNVNDMLKSKLSKLF